MPTVPTVFGAEITLPAIGFGTGGLSGAAGVDAVTRALDVGYRLLDSAVNYENEGAVGRAVRQSSVPREEVVVTSKLPGRRHGYDAAIATVEESLYRTGLDHLDLYLIHWPNPGVDRYVEAWQALITARDRGLVRAIGVSNFLPEHLDRLIDETGVTPAVNQIELHPFFPQAEQRAANADRGIITQAWCPIYRGGELLDHLVLRSIGEQHGVSAAQVVLRWHVQLGVVPIPKSAGDERQYENIDVFGFTLSDEEMDAISALGRVEGRLRGLDPATHEEL
jgi:diketogulonate reductase-like aldo/keto reductase